MPVFPFFPFLVDTVLRGGIISSDSTCFFSLDICLCPALYLMLDLSQLSWRLLGQTRLITSKCNLVCFFLNFLHPFALLQVNISSHSGCTLKYLFNTLCASFQYPNRLFKHAVGVFFPIYMTILFILSVCKDKNSNFHLIVSIKCYNFLFIFPGFCFWSLQYRENVAAKFWMYHSHSSPSLASPASTSCAPFLFSP